LQPQQKTLARPAPAKQLRTATESIIMLNNNSPLESLAAFAITFAVGILSTVALGKYIEKVRRDAANDASHAA
jgi:hypothetical protein